VANYRLYCLGRPILELDGKPVKLEMRKSLALLVYLRMAERDYSRESLSTLFWPEYDQQHALANLRRTLSSLNKSIRAELLDADREKISLKDHKKVWLDVEEFQKLLSTPKDHTHPQNQACSDCLRSLEEAIQLYRGDFLEGFNLGDCAEFDEWQFLQCESLRQEFAAVLQRVAEGYAAISNWERAIAYTRRWVALDRLNELAQRTLITLYDREGQRSAALKQYEELAHTLKDELGQLPEGETLDLYRKIQQAAAILSPASLNTVSHTTIPFFSEPLLKTKLHIPISRDVKVHRERLINQLSRIDDHALTILSAPAGFGKTTALVEWTVNSPLPVGWVSLDKEDNDPVRFLSYLVAAFDCIESGTGADVQTFLQSGQRIPLTVALINLLHDLETIQHPSILVLDDYQFIENQSIHQAVAYLIDHLPTNIHILIASRATPPLPLARLRSQGKLLEIRTQELYFTNDEAGEYLNQVMKLGLTEAEIAALVDRTEGWIVGLKMAALALQSQPSRKKPEDVSEFIQAFTGSNRYILDYLLEEVLSSQPATIKNFLLKTSILDSLNRSLCDAVLGDPGKEIIEPIFPAQDLPFPYINSQQILEHLERANLFVVPIDDERLWYRYHHLFANLLSNRLSQYLPPTDIQELHRRACYWFVQNNLNDKAMHHALFAGEYDLAMNIIEKNALQMIGKGETITLMSWIANLPDELVNERLLLLRFKIWGFGFAGKINQAELLFPKIEEILDLQTQSTETQAIQGEIALFRGVAANYRCQFQEASDQCQKALALIPESSTRIRAVAVFALGDIYRAQGDLLRSSRAFVEAGWMAQEFGEFWSQIQSLWSRAVVSEIQGRLNEAESLYQQAYAIASEHGLQPGSVVMVDVGMSGLCYQWNKLDQAWRLLSGGVENISWPETMHWWESPNMIVPGYLILARLFKYSGDTKAAKSAVEKAVQLCTEFDVFPDICSQVQAEFVRSCLEQGEMAKAAEWLEKYQFNKNSTLEVWHECEDIASMRVLLALGRFAEAQSQLVRLTASAEDGERIKHLIEMLVLQALALHATENHHEALVILRKALTLAQPEGYVRIYLDEGKNMESLLLYGMEQGTWNTSSLQEYVSMLLNAFEGKKIRS